MRVRGHSGMAWRAARPCGGGWRQQQQRFMNQNVSETDMAGSGRSSSPGGRRVGHGSTRCKSLYTLSTV